MKLKSQILLALKVAVNKSLPNASLDLAFILPVLPLLHPHQSYFCKRKDGQNAGNETKSVQVLTSSSTAADRVRAQTEGARLELSFVAEQ